SRAARRTGAERPRRTAVSRIGYFAQLTGEAVANGRLSGSGLRIGSSGPYVRDARFVEARFGFCTGNTPGSPPSTRVRSIAWRKSTGSILSTPTASIRYLGPEIVSAPMN